MTSPNVYTYDTIPAASAANYGAEVYLTDELGGPTQVVSNGIAWYRVSDGMKIQPSNAAFSGYRMSLGVPLYTFPVGDEDPGSVWDTYIALGFPKLGWISFTPDASQQGAGGTGAGTAVDPKFYNAVQLITAAGVKAVGYIRTEYTLEPERSLAIVYNEIDKFYEFYGDAGLAGIFIDEVDGGAGSIPYYQAIRNYLDTKATRFLVLNPGTNVDEGFMQIADVICTFEGTYDTYLTYTTSAYCTNYDPRRFSHLIHTCDSQAKADIAFNLAQSNNAGYVFITDGVEDFPWNPLSSWQTELVAKVTATNNDPETYADVAGMVHEYSADNVTKVGTAVSAVLDQGPVAKDLTGGGGCTWVASDATLNNLPVLSGNGTTQYLQNSTFDVEGFNGGRQFCVLLIYKGNADDQVIVGSDAATPCGFYHSAGFLSEACGNFVSSDGVSGTGWNVALAVFGGFNGSLRKLWLNGVAKTIANPGDFNWLKLGLFGYQDGTNLYAGRIRRVNFWNRNPGVTDVRRILTIAQTETGITLV